MPVNIKEYLLYLIFIKIMRTKQRRKNMRQILNECYDTSICGMILDGKSQYWIDALRLCDCSTLKYLNLQNCDLFDNNIEVLLKKNWSQLTDLDLSGNIITTNGLRQLTNLYCPKLQEINLGGNQIQDDGLKILLSKVKIQLQTLIIDQCNITGRGMQYFVNCPPKYLKKLNLNFNIIENVGLKLLVKANLPNLEYLSMAGCKIDSIKYLAKARWPFLNYLDLGIYECQTTNILQLDCWQSLHQHQWVRMRKLAAPEEQFICWINLVVIQAQLPVEYCQQGLLEQNQVLSDEINKVLVSRNILPSRF